ncbi:MAG: YidE/YbjL duplication [Clostridia bacterium]|nr:YidE/YbjL duplication [Clostridia bacterium]
MLYLGTLLGSIFSPLFIIFAIVVFGYLVGAIKIKGISLGTAGVLLIALAVGIIFSQCGEMVESVNANGETVKQCVWEFTIGGKTVTLWNKSVQSVFSFVSKLGTGMFVTAVGLIAGPKFFRSFNKSMLSYLAMGAIVILTGVLLAILVCVITGTDIAMCTGLLTGALTSTPGLSAAQDAATGVALEKVTAGYAIGYLYGVLGVVLFVQIIPKLLKVDIAKERESFVAASAVAVNESEKKRFQIGEFGFFPFALTVMLGILLGSIKIGIFSLGTSGGTLIAGLIIGHFGHVGKIDLTVPKSTLNFFREFGLVMFLIGAGLPGGISFIDNFKPLYFLYGVIFTTVPMIVGFVLAKYVFKLSIFNNLGSITGGMTSTPALGSLISVAGTDDVASAYAATYPVALVLIVIASNLMILIGA